MVLAQASCCITHSLRLVFLFIKKLSGFIFANCKMLRNCCATLSKIYEQFAYLWKKKSGGHANLLPLTPEGERYFRHYGHVIEGGSDIKKDAVILTGVFVNYPRERRRYWLTS